MDKATKKKGIETLKDEEFDDLKKKTLPIELQDHFAKNREVFQNNITKFENLTKQLGSINTNAENKAILAFILDLGQSLYGATDVLLEHNEIAYFGLFLLREEIDRIRNTLNQQGIDIDDISQYKDGLRFVDDYIKHASREDDTP